MNKVNKRHSGGILAVAAFLIFANPSFAGNSRFNSSQVLYFNSKTLSGPSVSYETFNLNSKDEISSLESHVNEFLKLQKIQKKQEEQSGQSARQVVVGPDLKQPYNSFDITSKGLKVASTKILSLIEQIRNNIDPEVSKYQIAQISRAIQQNYTDAYDGDFEIMKIPIYLAKYFANPRVSLHETEDEPTPKFIQNQLQTKSLNKGANFFDFLSLKLEPKNCQYLKAKRGYGVHAGFQVDCDGEEYKVKFGNEIHSGPFNARIFRAMGYLAPQINYQKSLEISYDRRLFLEINQRQPMNFSINLATIPVYKFSNKKMFDPFTFIKSFKLKTGQEISGEEGRRALVGGAGLIRKEGLPTQIVDLKESDFNEDFERQIDQVYLVPTTVTLKKDKTFGTEIGLWSISDLDYSSYKEIRGLMILSAWIGNYDVRKQNLMVSLVGNGDEEQLKLGFADSGSGLGKGTLGLKKFSSSVINDMTWTVTTQAHLAPPDNTGYQASQPLDVVILSGLSNTEPNSDFNHIKLSDAHWVLAEMCKNIDKKQITQALVASGMTSAEVVLAREKLLERRNQMLLDLKMPQEVTKECYTPVSRNINYDPKRDGLVVIFSDARNANIEAPEGNMIVVKGEVVQRLSN